MRVLIRVPIVLSLLLACAARAQTGPLHEITWTNPAYNALPIWAVDPETGDSTRSSDCHLQGSPLQDLETTRIWAWPAGRLPYLFATLDSRGREGLRDSTLVPEGANYYLTFVDTTGTNESCPTNIAWVGSITGVPTSPAADQIVMLRIFDLQGRLIRPSTRTPSGIRFYKATWRSGRVTSGKLPPIVR